LLKGWKDFSRIFGMYCSHRKDTKAYLKIDCIGFPFHLYIRTYRHIIFFRSTAPQNTYEDFLVEAGNICPNLVAATFTSRTMQDRPRTVGYSRNNSHHNDTKILKHGPEEDIMPICFASVYQEPVKQEVCFSQDVFESDSPVPIFPLSCSHTLKLHAHDDSVANLTGLARNLRRFYNPSPLFETLKVREYMVKFYEPLPQLNQVSFFAEDVGLMSIWLSGIFILVLRRCYD
jgi:hypothetical protein